MCWKDNNKYMQYRIKFIEVTLPLKAINAESARAC